MVDAAAGGVVWRVRLPAAADAFLRATSGKLLAMQRREAGIFEWQGKRHLLPDHPVVIWMDEHGRRHQHVDPYSFRPKLGRKKLARFLEGSAFDSHRLLGAHLRTMDGIQGVRFAVWAPNAVRVCVVGDFNGWNGAAHPMRSTDSGVWVLFIPGVEPGALYKFELNDGERSWLKADPYAFRAEHRPRTASVVTAPSAYPWGDEAWLARRAESDWLHAPMTVYEVHPGSWRPSSAPGYRDLARDLVRYVKDRGFTHIELLPIAEHPLDDSWGYQTTGYFAPTSRYGDPDDLRYLVDCAHQQDIGVILDWTPGHFPKDAHGLALFDGTYLYEHADPKQREHPDWNTLVFNYARYEVRSFLFSNAAYWLDEFHFDGLRVDAVSSMLYLDYSRKPGQWTPNEFGGNENLGAMAFLRDLNTRVHRDFPGAVVIAEESTAWPQVSRPTYVGGLGFSMKWNLGWMHDTLAYLGRDPIHRKYHHDALTFTVHYAFTENFLLPLSHDEVVHGKGSLLAKMPGDAWQQLANLRLLLCHQYTMPGKKLLFMGGEIAARQEWDFRGELAWDLLDDPAHAGTQRLVDDLNALVRSLPALHELDFDSDGFEWLDCHDSNQSVIAFMRKASRHPGQQHVVCVLNFTPVPRFGYRLGVPAAGTYVERLNSDSSHYGGSDVGNGGACPTEPVPWMGWPQSLTLTLPPLGALILAPAPPSDR